MNLPVLIKVAKVWVEVFDYDATGSARTPPLPALVKEVLAVVWSAIVLKGLW